MRAWQPRSTILGYPYHRRSGISTVALPTVHPGYLPLRGMQDPPQQRLQPQNTVPGDLNLQGSAVTYTQGIPRFLPPRGMQGARHHGWQPQITMSYNPYFIGSGVPTHTLSTVNLESFLPHQTQYGFHPQSASQSFPQPQFSGPVTCSVTHSSVIPGNRTRAPLQAQPQSASPVDLYLNGPITSSFTHPYGNFMRAPQLAPLPQSASPGGPHLSGRITSSVTHPPVIPGNRTRAPLQAQQQSASPVDLYLSGPITSSFTHPYGNRMRAPQLAPLPQSASSGGPHLSGPITSSVTHPPVIPGNRTRAPLQAQQQSASPVDLYLSGPITSSFTHPYGNRMRAPQQAPRPQGASSGGPYLSGPITPPVTHSPVIPGFFSPSGMQRGSSEVQHERNPSTESDTRPSQ